MPSQWIAILEVLFLVATGWQVLNWLGLGRAAWRKEPPAQWADTGPGVSIVVCARNEADRLIKNLPRLFTQTYRPLEIVVVDDDSDDETQNILTSLSRSFKSLRIVKICDKKFGGKKLALKAGIEAATYDWLLLTDADCYPASERWVAGMMHEARKGADIVLGIGLYERWPGWLNRFIRYETALTALQYGAAALWGQPYMGVGRNLLYHRRVFEAANGFTHHLDLISGDDDLLINEVASEFHTSIRVHPGTFTLSEPKKTIPDWYRQKRRHLSTATRYKRAHQLWLGSVSASLLVHYVSGAALVAVGLGQIAMAGWLLRQVVMHAVMWPWLLRLRQQDLGWWLVALDGLLCLYYGLFGIRFLVTRKTNTW